MNQQDQMLPDTAAVNHSLAQCSLRCLLVCVVF